MKEKQFIKYKIYKKKNVVCSMILSSIMCVVNKFKRKRKKKRTNYMYRK